MIPSFSQIEKGDAEKRLASEKGIDDMAQSWSVSADLPLQFSL